MGKWDILNISIQYNAFCPLSEVRSAGTVSEIKSLASIAVKFKIPYICTLYYQSCGGYKLKVTLISLNSKYHEQDQA
jgi:hypothetical protein